MNDGENVNRRSFLIKIGLFFSFLIGIAISIPIIGALLTPLLRKTKTTWRPVGTIDQFNVGETVLVRFKNAEPLPWSGKLSNTASWLRRVSSDSFIAFSVNCTHLGCPVRWIPDSELFLCPCHGGVYNKDGSYAAGPPPHGLRKYPVRIRDGKVEIEASAVPITNI